MLYTAHDACLQLLTMTVYFLSKLVWSIIVEGGHIWIYKSHTHPWALAKLSSPIVCQNERCGDPYRQIYTNRLLGLLEETHIKENRMHISLLSYKLMTRISGFNHSMNTVCCTICSWMLLMLIVDRINLRMLFMVQLIIQWLDSLVRNEIFKNLTNSMTVTHAKIHAQPTCTVHTHRKHNLKFTYMFAEHTHKSTESTRTNIL